MARLKIIHNKHAGRGRHLRGKAATDVQQAYTRALAIAPDAVRAYLAERDVDDSASDVSMAITDDDSPPPSPGTGCGPCREDHGGGGWRSRLEARAAPVRAAGGDVLEEETQGEHAPVPDDPVQPAETTVPIAQMLEDAGAAEYQRRNETVGRIATPEEIAGTVSASTPVSPANTEPESSSRTTPITTLFEQLESATGHALYRRITYKIVNGQKVPTGEKNTDSPAEIEARRGSGNILSLALKQMPLLHVVDVDTKALCPLKEYLDSKGAGWTETNKGYHYYVRVTGMIPYKQQQKVCVDESFDVDLLRQNNVWGNDDRVFHGTADIVETPWSDLEQYFNVPRMTGKNSPSENAPLAQKTPESTHTIDESALSTEMNRLLAEEPYSIDKKLTWFVLDVNDARARICNRENVCVARLCDKDGGEYLEHRGKNERQSLLMVCRKNKVEATCLGKCKKHTLTKAPGFGDCEALRAILWPGEETAEAATDDDVGQIKGLQRQQMMINDIALGFIQEHGLEKDAGLSSCLTPAVRTIACRWCVTTAAERSSLWTSRCWSPCSKTRIRASVSCAKLPPISARRLSNTCPVI